MMKKLFLKIITLSLAAVFAAAGFAGCKNKNKPDDTWGEPIDPDKTQLYIGNYYGGFGDEWLRAFKAEYETENPNIQIMIRNDKASYLRDELPAKMPSARENMYFVDNVFYRDMVSEKLLADITDTVTGPLTKYGESGSIEDKLGEWNKQYYKVDNKYYALPTYISQFGGMVYDVDLFYSKRLYFKEGSTAVNPLFITGVSDKKTAGPDGVGNTGDDGLPVTLTDFDNLLKRMRIAGVTPFTWTGKYNEYSTGAVTSAWANAEGYDNFKLNYTLTGSYKFEGDALPTQITRQNAYLLQKQSGKKHALDFAKTILGNSSNYSGSAMTTIQSHLDAQEEFLYSVMTNQRIAMLFEGDWWENEAKPVFADMAAVDSEYAFGTRRFAYMPFPKPDSATSARNTILSTVKGAFFINANISDSPSQLALAKDFLQFCHKESSLRKFNQMTGSVKPYTYALSEEEYNSLSHFGKSVYDMYKSDNVDIVYDLPLNDLILQNNRIFVDFNWTSNVSGVLHWYPIVSLSNNTSLTAQAYYDGLYTYWDNMWTTRGWKN